MLISSKHTFWPERLWKLLISLLPNFFVMNNDGWYLSIMLNQWTIIYLLQLQYLVVISANSKLRRWLYFLLVIFLQKIWEGYFCLPLAALGIFIFYFPGSQMYELLQRTESQAIRHWIHRRHTALSHFLSLIQLYDLLS